MAKLVEALATTALVISAVAVAGAAVHREIRGPSVSVAEPTYERDWESMLDNGLWLGSRDAAVKIVEFTDFQCPFCKRFHETYRQLQEKRSDMAIILVHYPSERIHPHAKDAARAAECAGAQGQADKYIDNLYAQQDSIGTKTWADFAHESGVTDLSRFQHCFQGDESEARVNSDIEMATSLQISGTPALIINGWRLPRPAYENLGSVIDDILEGKSPYKRSWLK